MNLHSRHLRQLPPQSAVRKEKVTRKRKDGRDAEMEDDEKISLPLLARDTALRRSDKAPPKLFSSMDVVEFPQSSQKQWEIIVGGVEGNATARYRILRR